jgi:hypothetical protein
VQKLDRHVYGRWSGKAEAHGFSSSVEEEQLCGAGARKHVRAGGAAATDAGLTTAARRRRRAWQ